MSLDPLWASYLAERTVANRNALAMANIGLVHRHTRRIVGFENDELVNMAMPGLLHAIETYDPDTGLTFANWAEWNIKGPLWRAVKRDRPKLHEEVIDVPAKPTADDVAIDFNDVQNLLHLLNENQRIYLTLVQRGMDGVEIGKVLGISKARASQIRNEIVTLLRPKFFCEG
jgi:RNA polymerase sigma factor (sigma-70 family)